MIFALLKSKMVEIKIKESAVCRVNMSYFILKILYSSYASTLALLSKGSKKCFRCGLKMHWTNPLERKDYTDSSGMVLYYTPILRNHSAQILQTGQFYLQLPPGQPVVHQDGICSSKCSSSLHGTVHIAEIILHMHYLG